MKLTNLPKVFRYLQARGCAKPSVSLEKLRFSTHDVRKRVCLGGRGTSSSYESLLSGVGDEGEGVAQALGEVGGVFVGEPVAHFATSDEGMV